MSEPARRNENVATAAIGRMAHGGWWLDRLEVTNEVARRKASLGLVGVCGSGATAAAMILERD